MFENLKRVKEYYLQTGQKVDYSSPQKDRQLRCKTKRHMLSQNAAKLNATDFKFNPIEKSTFNKNDVEMKDDSGLLEGTIMNQPDFFLLDRRIKNVKWGPYAVEFRDIIDCLVNNSGSVSTKNVVFYIK